MVALGNNPDLPEVFCWTKFGGEAGEPAEAIFQRKELERSRNGGIFLWGIGQSIRPSLEALLRTTESPEVVFSPIKAAASPRDLFPRDVVIWCGAIGFDGQRYRLPCFSLVTSKLDASTSVRSSHYALICERDEPILTGGGAGQTVIPANLRNLLSGSALGSSQVTSVVRQVSDNYPASTEYPVITRARLVYPYLVRLTCGVIVPDSCRLDRAMGPAYEAAFDSLMQLRRSSESYERRYSSQELLPFFG